MPRKKLTPAQQASQAFERMKPKAVKHDVRICFGLIYFDDEKTADAAGSYSTMAGHEYNGGWFHGMPCGRDKSFDHTDPKLGKLYAVTY